MGGFRGRGWRVPTRGQSAPRVQVTRRLRQDQSGAATAAEGSTSGNLDADSALAAAGLDSEPEDGEPQALSLQAKWLTSAEFQA